MTESKTALRNMADLGVSFITKTRLKRCNLATPHFADTVIELRDDNRQMLEVYRRRGERKKPSTSRADRTGRGSERPAAAALS